MSGELSATAVFEVLHSLTRVTATTSSYEQRRTMTGTDHPNVESPNPIGGSLTGRNQGGGILPDAPPLESSLGS